MKIDSFVRVLLIIIATLLVLNVMLPMLSNPSVSYAAKNVEYKIMDIRDTNSDLFLAVPQMEILFNELGKEGWELIQVDAVGYGLVIFKR